MTNSSFDMWQPQKLFYIIPTVLAVLSMDIAIHTNATIPLPFTTLIVTVIIAASFGGFAPGFLAGLISAGQIIFCYFLQFGPEELTGGLLQTLLGSLIFTLVGARIGWVKESNDMAIASLRATEQDLQLAVGERAKERDQQAAKVAERDDQIRQAMRLSGIGFFKWDAITGNCEFCSEQHAAHFGLSPQEFQTLTGGREPYVGYVHEDDRQSFLDAIARIDGGEALPFDYRIVRPNGEIRHIRQINEPLFDSNGVETAVVGSSIDFTELHASEERLRQSQRIETIGNLTGGVAHDFNNLLAVILGNLELSLESKDTETRNEFIGEAMRATHRGADLVKSLLSFARRAHLTPTRLNLNQLLNNTMIWSSRVLPKNISVETSLAAELWDTELDAASAESAVINLLLNARDAMPEGGKLTLETANMVIGKDYIGDRHEDVEPGRYVLVAISDTGHGIARDKYQQIFEPFYTEKPVGQGTGLGLSMVQGFIKQSNGTIRIYSELGEGTTFKLYFRACDSTNQTSSTFSKDTSHPEIGIRILVAEDDKCVARILKSNLEKAGHCVTLAANGDEALETFKTAGPFDMLLTDIVMPGKLDGPALAEVIRTIEPKIPCIFLSGYATEATVHGNGLKSSDIRLMKPVSRDQLLATIAQAWENRTERLTP